MKEMGREAFKEEMEKKLAKESSINDITTKEKIVKK